MKEDIKNIIDILACPDCHSSLLFKKRYLFCQNCHQDFHIIDFRPILLPKKILMTKKIDDIKSEISNTLPSKLKNFGDKLMYHWLDKSIFNYINQLPTNFKILNLGSGAGLYDKFIKKEMINLDLALYNKRTDIIGDAHQLPLKSESFNCVFCQALLEHTSKPWKIAEEIHRVLKTGGCVIVGVPFLEPLHGKTDYYRFTEQGLEEIFCKFKKIKSGICTGSFSFLNIFLAHALSLLMPIKSLRKLILYSSAVFLWPLKYLDVLIINKENLKIIASSIYFIGKK